MSANDPWNKMPDESSFGRKGAQVEPSDGADLDTVAKGLYVLAGGTVAFVPVDNADGEVIVTGELPAGVIVPYYVRRVRSTGTTATVAAIDG